MVKSFYFLLASLVLFTSCKDFFGKKTDLDFIEVPVFEPREVAYVPVQPVLNNFIKPTGIFAGFDELMYIVDEGNETIVCLDESGREIGRKKVNGVTAIAQTRKLDILAIGHIPQTVGDSTFFVSCIYRLNLLGNSGYGLSQAVFTDTIIHPLYYTSQADIQAREENVRFTGIDVLADNRFYVTRSGRGRGNIVFGPDNAVLLFNQNGGFVRTITVNTPDGFLNDFFKSPSAISTFVKPRQITAGGPDHFLVAMTGNDASIKVRIIDYLESDFGAGYEPRILNIPSTGAGFLYSPNAFIEPKGITTSGDGSNFIFVVDQQKDSLYQFTFTGQEGVPPPPGAVNNLLVKSSFGGRGNNLNQFNRPTGVAYQNRILWITDSGNGRVLRFKLTLDF